MPFIAISEAVFAALVDARVQAIESLTQLVLDERGLTAMLAEMARASGIALCLRDAGGTGARRRPAEIQPGDPGVIRLPLVTGSQVEAELLAQPGERCDRQLLHHVRTVLAVELLKRRAVARPSSGWRATWSSRCCRARSASGSCAGSWPPSGSPASYRSALRCCARAARCPAAGRAARGRRAFGRAGARDGGVAVLIEAADDDAAEAGAQSTAGRDRRRRWRRRQVRVSPSELHRSYDEALYATIARPGNGQPRWHLARPRLDPAAAVAPGLARHGALLRDVLGPLVATTASTARPVESLQAFIEANGRWADAAAELHVHRHTLRYRIRQIEELTGRGLSNARDRLELWMALRAHALQETHRDGRATPV